MIATIGDLIRFIEASETAPTSKKRYLCSALRRARYLLSNGQADIPADPKAVLRQLDRLSPAMAGMSRQSYANLKSRVRSSFRLVAPHLAPARSHARLTGDWAILGILLPTREHRELSRFMRFAQGMGWSPYDVREEHMQRFEAYLEHEVLREDSKKVVRASRRAWNRAVDAVPQWPGRRVERPEAKQRPDTDPAIF